MIVMKFGGTSVANADRIRAVAGLVRRERQPVVVVTSALGGVTDELIGLGVSARRGAQEDVDRRLAALRQRHVDTAHALAGPDDDDALLRTIDELLAELEPLLQGVCLLQELSARSSDLLVSFGERLAAPLVAAAIRAEGVQAAPVDARTLIVTDAVEADAAVDIDESRRRTRSALLPRLETDGDRTIPVVTGFIAASPDGHTTTLGRGGSDYTAALVGSFLDADAIWIWTDVDGVMTADPRIVPEARVLDAVTYREAAEMAYFGSKVLHPRTIIPAVERRIPVRIRNTFNPEHPGTLITAETEGAPLGVKTVTSVSGLALVTVEGSGMQGVPGVARRVFTTTAAERISVLLVSQASSEHNISLVVRHEDGARLVRALEREFDPEIARRQIDRVDMMPPVGIVAVIGEGMKGSPGVAQRMFTALGRGGISVLAIAQGSSELNLSAVVPDDDLAQAVGATHSRFGLTRDTHLFLLGKGLVGGTLIRQLVTARARLAADHGIGLPVIGICGSNELLLEPAGLDDDRLLAIADGTSLRDLGGEPRPDDEAIFRRIADSRWLDVVLVDATAEDNAATHLDALHHGFHVVTANKKPMSGPLRQADAILREAGQRGLGYHFETTFAAGLPALSTLQDLVATCDTVHRIAGCFSGTLGFICTAMQAGEPFSGAVIRAQELGYAEPDPREDLSGRDVARKALIIGRQLGAALEMEDVELEPLAPPDLMDAPDAATFLARLGEADELMARRAAEAKARGGVLRYVADITPDAVRVGPRDVPVDDAAGQLSGPDNILVFHTERYRDYPLVIRGPGAGAAVTAAGLLGDILKIVRAS